MNKKTLAAALAAPLFLACVPAWAQTADTWRYSAAVYAFLPDISGRTTFPEVGGGGSTVDAATIIDNLKFTFMGAFEAHQGRWGVMTDVVYMDLGNSKSGYRDLSLAGAPLPGGASANVHYDLKGWSWTLAGLWRVSSSPSATLDLLGGARMLDMRQTLNWEITGNVGPIALPGLAGESKAELTNWDAIVGAKGRLAFGEGNRWFAPYYVDVGTGDSDLTWQAFAGLGYSFGWGDVVAVWRYLDYDMKSGGKIESMDFNGPAIAAVFRW